MNAYLLVIQGPDQGQRFELAEGEIGLGRGVRNEIRIQDGEASRAHARLALREGRFVLTDLQSSNGTYVNGRRIDKQALRVGDEVQVGRTVFRLLSPEEAAPRSTRRIDWREGREIQSADQIVSSANANDPSVLMGPGEPGRTAQSLLNLQVLYRIAEETVSPATSIEALLTRILELALRAVQADRGCVLVRNPTSGILETVASRDQRGDLGAEPMPVSRSIVDYVLKHRQGVRTSDARADTRFTSGASILQAGIREAICVPMPGRYDLQGVIYLDITTSADQLLLQGGGGARFTEDLLLLMVAIGRQAALAVEDNQYQQALVKSERLAAVGQTIAILSHHIKNILQGVRGGSFLIDRGLNTHDEPMVRKGWTILEKNQQRIYDLVMDMLSLSKERQLILKGGDLNETVGEACELLQARATELNVALEWTPQPGLPPMQFDAEAIHRAVLNIGGNALEAVEGGDAPCVKISTSYDPAGHLVLITVSDNGPGIPPEILPGLFNIFESSKGSRGTGIGLAVSRKIIREHGGDIEVRSQPGEGATFILAWPLIAEELTLVPTDE